MGNLLEFAKEEMKILNGENPDEMQSEITKDILELIEVFANQGHSGFSANYALNIFDKLARWKPITVLSFDDEWWIEHERGQFQHKRNSAIFKEGKNGRPYYIDAYVECWEEDQYNCWGGNLLLEGNKRVRRCYIKDSTHMPKIKILIPVVHNSDDPADWEFLPLPENKLDELKKYYDLEIVEVENE